MTWSVFMVCGLSRKLDFPAQWTSSYQQFRLWGNIYTRNNMWSARYTCFSLSLWHQEKVSGYKGIWRLIPPLAKQAALVSGVGEYTRGGVEVTSTVVAVEQQSHVVEFDILNRCTRHVNVPGGAVMANRMQVQMLDISAVEKEEFSDARFLNLFGQDFKGNELPQWLLHCVMRNKDTFSKSDFDLAGTDVAKHSMRLDDYSPFKERAQRVPPHMYEEVRQHLHHMLDLGVIRPSNSPWTSNVVLVRKTSD